MFLNDQSPIGRLYSRAFRRLRLIVPGIGLLIRFSIVNKKKIQESADTRPKRIPILLIADTRPFRSRAEQVRSSNRSHCSLCRRASRTRQRQSRSRVVSSSRQRSKANRKTIAPAESARLRRIRFATRRLDCRSNARSIKTRSRVIRYFP